MGTVKKRNLFVTAVVLLLAIFIVLSVFTTNQGPRESLVELISREGSSELKVRDLYEGEMIIPSFSAPVSQYKPDQFVERRGIVTYGGGDSYVGINVSEKQGDIDWEQVAASDVDYAMIRVGFREYGRGRIVPDKNFQTNIKGALDAGIPVGVYFYSKAVTDAEAEEEATFILEQIKEYTISYPVAFYWQYGVKDDGTRDEGDRTVRCNGQQVTSFINTFCRKVSAVGYTASYYCDKSMGYQSLDLSQLKNYDMWYAEFRTVPSFYYNFQMWQYTKEGTVPGIQNKVPVNLSLKKYR